MPNTTYTTIQGDTWDGMAKKLYGSEYHMDVLMAANPRYLPTVFFSAGVVLQVPAMASKTVDLPTPPWRS